MADEIYKTLTPREKGERIPGQIFWIPSYLYMPSHHVIRYGKGWDRTKSIADASLTVVKRTPHTLGNGSDVFQHMPIPELQLKLGEELVVKKVKRRPAILILQQGVNSRRFADFKSGITQKAPNPSSHVFAPIVSLKKEAELDSAYPQAFIDEVKAAKLPEFIHLPARKTEIVHESMATLCHLQSHDYNLVEPTDLAINSLYLANCLETFWTEHAFSMISDDEAVA